MSDARRTADTSTVKSKQRSAINVFDATIFNPGNQPNRISTGVPQVTRKRKNYLVDN